MVETQTSTPPNGRSVFCYPENTQIASTAGSIYVNTKLVFTIDIPSGWNVPPSDDGDPHFVNCLNKDGFEIHSGNNPSSLFVNEYEEYLHQTYTKTLHVYNGLVSGAIVREFTIIEPEGDGWPHWSVILFPKEKVAYYFASLHSIEKYPFVSTFRLVK